MTDLKITGSTEAITYTTENVVVKGGFNLEGLIIEYDIHCDFNKIPIKYHTAVLDYLLSKVN